MPQTHSPQTAETVFSTSPEDGPGELLYVSKRRRFGSFSRHTLLLILILLGIVGLAVLANLDRSFSRNFPTYAALALFGAFLIYLDLVPRSLLTKYSIYERRIDIQRGILFRKHVSIWIFEITNLTYTRNPIDLLTRNATITIELQNAQHRLSGLCSPKTKPRTRPVKFVNSLFEELRNTVREQRGSVKKVWI